MKQSSLFSQLIFNIVFPVVFALLLLGIINTRNTRQMIREHREMRNYLISDELVQILHFQDLALGLIEDRLNESLEYLSNRVVHDHLQFSRNIANHDLSGLRSVLNLDPDLYDFYIIDTNGIIINTTFSKDLGFNLFSLGEMHEVHLRNVFSEGKYVSERFAIEASTRRLKKYTYHPTPCNDYIFEIGVYSPDADRMIGTIRDMLEATGKKHKNILSAELFMNEDDPFSLTKTDILDLQEQEYLKERFRARDSLTVDKRIEGRRLSNQYLYKELNNSGLYKGSVVRIITDRTDEIRSERMRLLVFLGFFTLTLVMIIFLIYRKTRVITNPIKRLVEHVNRISDGHFSERAEITGSSEIVTLSTRFNKMIAELEELYRDLEQKVRDRTAEVVQQKAKLEAQHNILIEQQRQILDSITYSKRLQNAILPTNDFVYELFPESFIFYLPKDIISGDFYWFFSNGSKKFFSAIDCTGHGVPGALLSMVGQNWLNYAVKDMKLTKPSDILDVLNEGVMTTFKENDDDTSVKDGMDLAVCCIDYNSMKMQFAGAYNPVLIISNGEAIQIKGDKFPVGAFLRGIRNKFSNHEMDVKKGDVVYLYSDGYPDQFGGDRGSKFMTKHFRQLLIDIHHKPMKEQKQILKTTLEEWMGDHKQIDDITIIGIKV
jgi:phosphoserine phosphatase RsbU/P